jgi:hypothetical protein
MRPPRRSEPDAPRDLYDLDRDGSSREQGVERRSQTTLREDDRMDPSGQLREFREPWGEILLRVGQDLACGRQVTLEPRRSMPPTSTTRPGGGQLFVTGPA